MLNLTGTGNTVANYREDEIPCPECEGTGRIYQPDKQEVLMYLDIFKAGLREKIDALKEWTGHNGYITCRECEGDKMMTVRR